jgi:hypothetical protein
MDFCCLVLKPTKTPYRKDELEFVEGLCIISTAALVNSQLFNELKKYLSGIWTGGYTS